jgi:putative spermidine/putrescine transport system permease protein
MTQTTDAAAVGDRPEPGGRRLSLPWLRTPHWLGTLPFLAYIGIFLLLPTLIVVVQSFFNDSGALTFANLSELGQSYVIDAFRTSVVLSAETAVTGAALGAVLAYVVATGPPDGILRKAVTAACGVLAQSGGVTLAFAFIATIGSEGFLTAIMKDATGRDISSGLWLFDFPGLVVVYTYFQIPLMVLVFLPALDGIRPQWREAAESLGGSTWDYWRHVALPILTPPFLGALLLLFANAFSAYATAAALISQGAPIVPLQIANTFSSEVILGRENIGKALALGMIVIVAIVMTLNAMLQRRTSRWLR